MRNASSKQPTDAESAVLAIYFMKSFILATVLTFYPFYFIFLNWVTRERKKERQREKFDDQTNATMMDFKSKAQETNYVIGFKPMWGCP